LSQKFICGDEASFIFGQGVNGIDLVTGVYPVFKTAVIDFYISVAGFFDDNCRLVGDYSPVTHSVGYN